MTQEYIIIQDSREKKKLWKEDEKHVTAKLDTGDYSIEGYTQKLGIERKSCSDAVATL